MKKLLKVFTSLALVVVSLLCFTGCSKAIKVNAEGSTSNGKIATIYNGYMYYIAGVTETNTITGKDTLKTSIYKIAVDDNNNIKSNAEPVLVYDCIAGISSGSLAVFGDYLFFVTPSKQVGSSGSVLSSRTSFCRVKIDGTDFKAIYSTETEKSITYSYYFYNQNVYAVVLESEELYSINLSGKKVNKTIITEAATSVVLSDNFGVGDGAENFVFYTENPTDTFITQLGSNVYKCNPDGSQVKIISSGEDIKLLQIINGYLYFSVDGNTICRSKATTGLTTGEKVSFVVYSKNYTITKNGEIVAYITEGDSGSIVLFDCSTGTPQEKFLVSGNTTYTILFADSSYVYLQNSSDKLIYRISMYATNQTPVKITTKIAVSAGTNMYIDIVGDYIVYMVEAETKKDEDGKEIKNTVKYTTVWEKLPE